MKKCRAVPWDWTGLSLGAMGILGGCFLLGGLLGGVLAGLMPQTSAEALGSYLGQYLSATGAEALSPRLWPLLWEQLRFLLGIVLLGFTALGVIGIPALFGVRGFLFSFSVGGLCRVFGPVGLIPALVLFGFPACLWAPTLFVAGTQSLEQARAALLSVLDGGPGPKVSLSAALVRLSLCGMVLLACAWLEQQVAPGLLRAVTPLVLD